MGQNRKVFSQAYVPALKFIKPIKKSAMQYLNPIVLDRRMELWDGLVSFLFMNDDLLLFLFSVKGENKENSEAPFLRIFREFDQLSSRLSL